MDKIIKQKREELGLSQDFFAKVLGIKQNTLSNYEQGVRKPRGKIAKKISVVLEIPLEDII